MTALIALALIGQNPAQTYDASFVMHGEDAYVASPVYPLAFKGDRVTWSANSKRAAFVAPAQFTPARFAQAAARGEPLGTERVMVWNGETGKVSEVAVPRDATQGFDKIEFVGNTLDLVISTFWGDSVENTRWGVLYIRDGGTPFEIPLGETKSVSIAISRVRPDFLILTDHGAWHSRSGSVGKADLPVEVKAIIGLAADDSVQLVGDAGEGQARYYSYDFATRRSTLQNELKPLQRHRQQVTPPFFFDLFQPAGLKRATDISDEDLSRIDANARRLSDEDGGIRMDLVERAGDKRRRLPFIWEMSRYFYPSPDGLSVAYTAQGLLCVRSVVKCNKETTAKLLGGG